MISFGSSAASSSDNVSLAAKKNPDGTATLQMDSNPPRAGNCVVAASPNVALSPVKIVDTNPNRIGLLLYNNSSNSAYFKYGAAGNAGTDMTFIVASFTTWVMPQPVYTGPIYGQRNAGSGVVVATDLTS